MTEINQTAGGKIYTVSSSELIYKGAGVDDDLNTYRDADMWYEGTDRVKALRIAREYAADVRDTGKVEVCEQGITRKVFEVCKAELDSDGDIVDEDTIEIVDPLDRMPKLRELADGADRCNCQLPSYITGERKWIDDIEIDGKCFELYRFELSAFGDFSAYSCNFDSAGRPELWLPAGFFDYGIQTSEQLKDMIQGEHGEWWQGWQTDDEYAKILYGLFIDA